MPTIQGSLEWALRKILGLEIRIHGSGRTDTGVHAYGQVCMLETACPIPVDKLILALNGVLPRSIRIMAADEVALDFHPRFSAVGKMYRYLFRRVDQESPFHERFSWQITVPLDIDRMCRGAMMFVGEHDFAAFTKSPQRAENTRRTILQASIEEEGSDIRFDVTGTGFLHNMVRNMARALFAIGTGTMTPETITELYRNQDRRRLGPPAPAGGLYLMKVMY